jgi:hypothetical protein
VELDRVRRSAGDLCGRSQKTTPTILAWGADLHLVARLRHLLIPVGGGVALASANGLTLVLVHHPLPTPRKIRETASGYGSAA